MRYSEILNEIERLSKSDYIGGRKDLRRLGVNSQRSIPLPGGSGFTYRAAPNFVLIFDPEKTRDPIAALKLYKAGDTPFPNALQVDTITVDERYRGMGLAKALYGIVLSIMKVPLVAGWGQTPGGMRNWASLATIPGVEVKGYVSIADRNFDIPARIRGNPKAIKAREFEIEEIQDEIMQVGGEYAGKKNGMHVFYFPVTIGSKSNNELVNAVKGSIIQTYRVPGEQLDWAGEEGLVAFWTGK